MAVQLDGHLVHDSEELRSLYEQRVAEAGVSSRAMFYRTSEQHVRKVEAYGALIRQLPPTDSILDVGCGYGLLAPYTADRSYLGVDLVPSFVREARRTNAMHTFMCCDVLTEPLPTSEWGVMCGVLSSVPDPPSILRRALSLARNEVFFDLSMSERLPDDFPDLNRWDWEAVDDLAAACACDIRAVSDTAASWLIFAAHTS